MSDIDEGKRLELNGSLDRPRRWLIAIMAVPTVGILVALALGYSRVAAPARAPMAFAAVVVPLVMLITAGLVARYLRRARVYVDRGELVIEPGVGGKRIALSALRRHGLSVIDLNQRTELKPFLRLWGTGLPGFAGGRFRLRDGSTAVCLLLDRSRVSYLRSDDGTAVLLSLKRPEQLRALLER